VVFLNSPHRETPKNVIKTNREKSVFDFLKHFRHDFFVKRFFVVFLNSHCRKTLENAISDNTQKVEEKLTSKFLSIFWKRFSTWTFYRETPKNVLKKNQEIKNRQVGGSTDLANVRGSPSIFCFAGPSRRWWTYIREQKQKIGDPRGGWVG
jgi:hypothetical protein